MDPIRPAALPPIAPAAPAQPGAEAARLAAQRAFFEAALGRTAASPPPAQVQTQAQTQAAQAPAPAADRPARPGSILDIRV